MNLSGEANLGRSLSDRRTKLLPCWHRLALCGVEEHADSKGLGVLWNVIKGGILRR